MEINETFINDFLVNIKSNTIIKERYELLVNFIIESTALGYNDKSKLRISDDYKILDLIKILEAEKYDKRLNILNENIDF